MALVVVSLPCCEGSWKSIGSRFFLQPGGVGLRMIRKSHAGMIRRHNTMHHSKPNPEIESSTLKTPKPNDTGGQPIMITTKHNPVKAFPDFTCHQLADGHTFLVGELPARLRFTPTMFEELWQFQPTESLIIHMHGCPVRIPRKQQAYGMDYHFSGQTSQALPVPDILAPLRTWSRERIDAALNGLLLNWYDGRLGHYIGKHRDSRVNMVPGAPIVTISLGEERMFRLAPWYRMGPPIDFLARDGTVFVMPYETNLAWTHAVPASRRYTGRRISITLRAFIEENASISGTH
jgi:alkylated DNA repair dioxygenase AlkB